MIVGDRVLTPSGAGEVVHLEKRGEFARGALRSYGRWWAAVRLDNGSAGWWTLEELRPESVAAKTR